MLKRIIRLILVEKFFVYKIMPYPKLKGEDPNLLTVTAKMMKLRK